MCYSNHCVSVRISFGVQLDSNPNWHTEVYPISYRNNGL